MKRRSSKTILLSLLLAATGAAVGNFAYAAVVAQQQAPAKAKGVPGPVTNLKVSSTEPREDGTADVTLSFTTPTNYYDDSSWDYCDGLDELSAIVIAENINWEKVEIGRIENPGMGVDLTYTIENVSSGTHTYYVYALNSDSDDNLAYNWDSYAYSYVTVGYAAPEAVSNLKADVNDTQVTISWDAPTAGANGGYLNANDPITYTVYRYSGYYSSQTIVAQDITETSVVDDLDVEVLTRVYYSVIAKNSMGESDENQTPNLVLGPAYELPFEETFPDGYAKNIWTSESNSSSLSANTYVSSWGGAYTGIDYQYLESAYDNDGGILYFTSSPNSYANQVDTYAIYSSGPISLKDAKNPGLSFYHYILPGETNKIKTSVIIEQAGVQTVVKSFNDYTTGNKGWNLEVINLTQFAGDAPIKVIFRADCNSWLNGFAAFDAITVDNILANDLFLSDLTVSSKVDAGSNFSAIAKVVNKGANTAENYTVELYADGKLIDSKAGDAIASSESAEISFVEKADNSYNEQTVIASKIVWADDENATNNSAEQTLKVRKADTPAPTDLTATRNNGQVALSWVAPDYTLPEFENTIESFEDFDDFATTIDKFGSWTIYDYDTHYPVYFEYKGLEYDEWQDEQMTYCVLNQDKLTITNSEKWFGKPHSGSKYLVSTAGLWGTRKDWLVSPELSGNEQTIEFYAVSNQFPTDKYDSENILKDQVFVYVSFTNNEQESFTYTALANADDSSKGAEITNALANGDDYQKFTAELPEGAKYFAIVLTTPGSGDSIVFIDDVSFEQNQTGIQVQLLGYDVYENSTKLNDAPISETSFTVENATEGATYSVVAVYNVGNSEAVDALAQSGVNNISANNIKVFSNNQQLNIVGAQSASVYDIAGRRIAQTRGNATLNLAPATYIVRADNRIFKVIVR